MCRNNAEGKKTQLLTQQVGTFFLKRDTFEAFLVSFVRFVRRSSRKFEYSIRMVRIQLWLKRVDRKSGGKYEIADFHSFFSVDLKFELLKYNMFQHPFYFLSSQTVGSTTIMKFEINISYTKWRERKKILFFFSLRKYSHAC